MSTDVAKVVEATVVHPDTGEIVHREDVEAVGALYRQTREWGHNIGKLKAWCNTALIEAMDKRAAWTLPGGYSAPSPTSAEITWDVEALAALEPILGRDRYLELVKETVIREPQTGALHKAAKAGGRVREIIEGAESRRPKNRYISVKG